MNLKIIDRYLWISTLQGLLIAWLALVLLDVFFAFISEAEKTNALYTTTQATIYLIYTLPARFYEFFPNAALIGTLLGLGNLAANSEFIAMRAAGLSVSKIIFSVVKLGLILAALLFVLGEWVVPNTDLQARNFKAKLKNKNIVLTGGAGLWVKDKNSVINIGSVISNKEISDISIYTFKNDHSGLESLTEIEKANANPILWTTHLMAPEAYTLKAAIDGWLQNETPEQIDERAAQMYNQYQKCGIRGARNLFTTGF